jgi:hypothetical protein
MSLSRAAADAGRTAAIIALLATVNVVVSIAARADVRVEGDAADLRIEASDVQVADVLSALGKTLQVRVRTPIVLNKVISGTYSGSLKQVLSRVLDGYNYVIKPLDATAEVVIIGVRGERAIAVTPPAPAPRRSLAAEWRSPVEPKAPSPKQ